jgi:serine/threonine-protein kinase
MLTMLPLQNSPDTLTVRARDIIRATGHAEAPADVAFRFQTEDGFVDYFRKSLAGTKASTLPQWKQILDVNPYPMSFWYRESPAPLLAERSLSRFRRVSLTDPAPVVPGMVSVVVDLEGRLLRFAAAADPTAPIDRAAMEPDWSPFFAAAGLDMSRFSGATPDSTAPLLGDARQAWTGSFANRAELPIRIEAASFRGRATTFDVRFPWTPPYGSGDSPTGPLLLLLILSSLLLLVVGLFARHNVTRNRSDVRGAYRISLCCVALVMLMLVAGEHHAWATWSLTDALIRQLPYACFVGLMCALFYLAIEPWVRRYWPEAMITWSRALAGRWRNPVVARDVLVGVVWGMISTVSQRVATLAVVAGTGTPVPPSGIFSPAGLGLEKLTGDWTVVADMAANVLQGYSVAVQYFFCLFLFRLLLRKPWLGAAACFVFLLVLNGGYYVLVFDAPAIIFVAIATGLTLFVALRFGVLTTFIFMCVAMFTDGFLLTTQLNTWYGQSSLIAVIIVSALALWAFRTSLGERPLIPAALDPQH